MDAAFKGADTVRQRVTAATGSVEPLLNGGDGGVWGQAPSAQTLQRQSQQLNAAYAARNPYQALIQFEKQDQTAQDDGDVLQMVAAQIQTATSLLDGSTQISKLTIVGRPANVFTNSAGDHTSAFTLHDYGLRARLEGRTIPAAIAEMDRLVEEMTALPGYQLVENMAEGELTKTDKESYRMAHLWIAAVEQLERIRTDVETDMDQNKPTNWWVSALQSYIVAYLEVRERIPLSTIKTKELGIKAGTNKNESAEKLFLGQAYHNGDYQDMVDGIMRNFDVFSAAGAASQQNPYLLVNVAPGLLADYSIEERMEMLARQHAMTINAYYPDVVDALTRSHFPDVYARSPQAAKNDMIDHIAQAILIHIKDAVSDHVISMVNEIDSQIEFLGSDECKLGGDAVKEQVTAWEERKKEAESFVDLSGRKIYKVSKKKGSRHKPSSDSSKVSDKMEEEKENVALKRSYLDAFGVKGDGKTELWGKDEKFAPPLKKDTKETLSINIELGKDDRISAVQQAGRPPHRFHDSAGAHTTAHLVYRDLVENSLKGKTVAAALTEMDQLREEHRKLIKRLRKFPKGPEDGSLKKLKARSGPANLARLQAEITDLMLAFELVPGVTLPGVATGGLGEADARKTLMAYEAGTPADNEILTDAVLGLLDVGAVMEGNAVEADEDGETSDYDEEDLIDILVRNHIALIFKTYPRVAKALKLTETSSRKPWVARLMNPDGFKRAKGVGGGGKNAKSYRAPPNNFDKRHAIDLTKFNFGKGKAFTSSDASLAKGSGGSLSGGTGLTVLPSSTSGDGKLKSGDGSGDGKAKGDRINNQYEYEDIDMYRALIQGTQGMDNLVVLPPVDDIFINQLSQRLNDAHTQNPGASTFLVPFNRGNFHWVGIVVRIVDATNIDTPGAVTFGYFDPLQGKRVIPNGVAGQITTVFPGALEQTNLTRLMQSDVTSCGPITVENLLRYVGNTLPGNNELQDADMTRAIRARQADAITLLDPTFRDRQEANQSSISSSFDVQKYLSGQGARSTFSPREWQRLLSVATAIKSMDPAVAAPLVGLLDRVDDFSVHQAFLQKLRAALFQTMTNVLKPENVGQRGYFDQILARLCSVHLADVQAKPNLNDVRFSDYEELRSLALHMKGKDLAALTKDMDETSEKVVAQDDIIKKLAEKTEADKKKK